MSIERESFTTVARYRKAAAIASALRGKFSANDVLGLTDEQKRMAERIAGVHEASTVTWGCVILLLREQEQG